MSDYKYEMQMIAEEAAEEMGVDFSNLAPSEQCRLYSKAMDTWHDQQAERADMMRDAARDAEMGI
jgi:hypothetical protein